MDRTYATRTVRSHSLRDTGLEDAFARRDAAAYDRAYELFASRMYTTAMRILQQRELARECVHDVFLHLWRKGGAYSSARGSLEAFLVVCARNAALARVRDDSRRRDLLAAQPPPPLVTIDPDPTAGDDIARAIAQLSPQHKEMIDLAYYRGMTHVQIAATRNEPVGTIKSRISSALRQLREALRRENSDA